MLFKDLQDVVLKVVVVVYSEDVMEFETGRFEGLLLSFDLNLEILPPAVSRS